MSIPHDTTVKKQSIRVVDAPPSTQEPVRKDLMQCQFCYRSRLAGASLARCSGCQIAYYCSKECQKKGWPAHKDFCKLNRGILADPRADGMHKLRAFTTKHRPTLAQFGKRALDLYDHPENAQEKILLVQMRPRPHPTSAERFFIVEDVIVGPPSLFGHNEEGIRGRMKYLADENERVGGNGGFIAVLMDVENYLNNVAGVGFTNDFERIAPDVDWKTAMIERMNDGFVL